MKRLFSTVAIMTLLALPALAGEANYGQALELDETTSIADILANPHNYEGKTVQVKGSVKSSCTEAGCWMRLDAGDGQVLLVKSSDESILVPKDVAGRTAVVEGVVVVEHADAASSDDTAATSDDTAKAPTCARASEEGHTCAQANVRLETKGVVLL